MKADAPRSPNEQIRVEHLLTHTTGGWEHGTHDPLRLNKDMKHRELIAWTLEHMPLTRPPGESFAYSNFGYCILGRRDAGLFQGSFDLGRRISARF
jgi:CubicO group peptidase (beta-lactamase class C family)